MALNVLEIYSPIYINLPLYQMWLNIVMKNGTFVPNVFLVNLILNYLRYFNNM